MSPKTLYDKIWDAHVAHEADDGTCLLYIDRHLVHEVTSPQAFEGLRMTGRTVRAPDKTIAVPDHNVPTTLDRAVSRSKHWTRTPRISASITIPCPMCAKASCTSSVPSRAGPCPA